LSKIVDIQKQLVEDFALFEGDTMGQYEYIIDLGKELPKLEEQYKIENNIVKGCQSTVWLHAFAEGDKVRFQADSNTVITKGIIALLVKVLDNQTPADIKDAELTFIDGINLQSHLSSQRSNGLNAMIKQMKLYALGFESKMNENKNGMGNEIINAIKTGELKTDELKATDKNGIENTDLSRTENNTTNDKKALNTNTETNTQQKSPAQLEMMVTEKIKEVFDPEIPVNIYELGLIYEIQVYPPLNNVFIKMTVTAPNCPVADSLPIDVRDKVKELDEVAEVDVELTFDPPWDKEMMSEEAKLELGFF